MTSYQKLKQEVEKLEHDKALLLKSIVYPSKMDQDDTIKIISMMIGYKTLNHMYCSLMEGDYTGDLPIGVIDFTN